MAMDMLVRWQRVSTVSRSAVAELDDHDKVGEAATRRFYDGCSL